MSVHLPTPISNQILSAASARMSAERSCASSLVINAKSIVVPSEEFSSNLVAPSVLQRKIKSVLSETKHRISICGLKNPVKNDISFHVSNKSGFVFSRNTMRCGSSACPVCSIKKQTDAKKRLDYYIDQHKKAGGSLMLLTLTAPHSRADDPEEWIPLFLAVNSRLKQSSSWRDLNKKLVGSSRSFEVTYSNKNGLHPHFHLLLFVKAGEDISTNLERVKKRWITLLIKSQIASKTKLKALNERAFDYRAADTDSSSYLTKPNWGISKEMTLAGKKSRSKSPAVLAYNNPSLFKRYVSAIKGLAFQFLSRSIKTCYGSPPLSKPSSSESIKLFSVLNLPGQVISALDVVRFANESVGSLDLKQKIINYIHESTRDRSYVLCFD